MTINDIQIGGTHYKAKVQHWDVCSMFDIPYLLGCMTKYMFRYPSKNGLEDLAKAYHYALKWKEVFYGNDIILRPTKNISGVLLNTTVQEFANSFSPDVDPRVKEMCLDILHNWSMISIDTFTAYCETLKGILDASDYKYE